MSWPWKFSISIDRERRLWSIRGVQSTISVSVGGIELWTTAGVTPEDWEPIDLRIGFGQTADLKGWWVLSILLGRSTGTEQRNFVGCLLYNRAICGPASPRMARDAQEVMDAV